MYYCEDNPEFQGPFGYYCEDWQAYQCEIDQLDILWCCETQRVTSNKSADRPLLDPIGIIIRCLTDNFLSRWQIQCEGEHCSCVDQETGDRSGRQ